MYRKTLFLSCTLALLIAAVSGCAPSRKYAWGKYDSTLYSHYKNPQEKEAHLERLKEIVLNADKEDQVPPGLYAEYGYALYESGNLTEAVSWFEKEKTKWPESKILMEKMIRNVGRAQENIRKSTTATPSGGEEAAK